MEGKEVTIKLGGGITTAQLNAWKAKNEEVYAIDVNVDDEGKDIATGYFKKPDLDIVAMAEAEQKNNYAKGIKTLVANCWLGGDERILTNSELQLAAAKQIFPLFKQRVAKIKKL